MRNLSILFMVPCFLTCLLCAVPWASCHAEQDAGTMDTATINRHIKAGEKAIPNNTVALMEATFLESKSINYVDGMARSLMFKALAYLVQQDFIKAEQASKEAIELCRSLPNAHAYLGSLNGMIGNRYQWEGRYEEAAQYFILALGYERSTPLIAVANINRSLGIVMMRMKRYREAHSYIDKAIAVIRAEHSPGMLGDFWVSKGTCYLEEKQFPAARACFEEVVKMARQEKANSTLLIGLNNIAVSHIKEGSPTKALPYLFEAAAIKNAPLNARLYVMASLGEAYLALKEYAIAERHLQEAAKKMDAVNDSYLREEIYRLLAQLYEGTGNYRQALHYQQAYTTLKDSSSNRDITNNINQLEIKYRTAQKDREIIKQQLEITDREAKIRTTKYVSLAVATALAALSILLYMHYRQQQQRSRKELEIRQLNARIEGIEQERERLARELHDGIGGMVAAVQLNLQNSLATGSIEEAIGLLKETSAEIRNTAHNLMPDWLGRYGFSRALVLYCSSFSSAKLEIDLQLHGNLEELDRPLLLTAYRIVQELVQNTAKHADATYAAIQVIEKDNKLTIMAEDNGQGFDDKKTYEGMGLQGIHSRIKAMNGHIDIMSQTGKGTVINIEIPIVHTNPLAP